MKPTTIKGFCEKHAIKIACEWADYNPNMMDDDPDGHRQSAAAASQREWARSASHWKVRLTRNNPRRALTTYFSQGAAHTSEPTAADVLGCLCSDASSVDFARDFGEWARDFDLSEDSRKAERTYKVCVRTGEKLRRFLGAEYDSAIGCEW